MVLQLADHPVTEAPKTRDCSLLSIPIESKLREERWQGWRKEKEQAKKSLSFAFDLGASGLNQLGPLLCIYQANS